jgi:lipopolysaccharide biosynthesis regulator YciM
MTTIAQEFSVALVNDRAEQETYKPLLEKFEELKQVLQSNFEYRETKRKWYGRKVISKRPLVNMEVEDKFTHITGRYLFISIMGRRYVMGIGEYGDLKGRLYFCDGNIFRSQSKDKTIVRVDCGMFSTTDYCLEDKITCVQLFAKMIKEYRQYLVKA